jgi:1-pyrroline-5-carboxylate dehydrogenase
VREAFVSKLLDLTRKINVGDPTRKENWMGPVINKHSLEDYKTFASELREAGNVLHGGEVLDDLDGYYTTPLIATDVPEDHRLWKLEMFLPIVTIAGFDDLDDAMAKANDVEYGLTAGFYSEDEDEIEWFLSNIEAGVLYVNRESGATTGAWPGYQAFGGWKGSGSTGKAGGSRYYVQQYMHEQSQTVVD